MIAPSHAQGIDYLVDRLEKKGRCVLREVTLYSGGTILSDADVLTIDCRDGLFHTTRYEVKSGLSGRNRAKRQARRWYAATALDDAIMPRFVYYNTATKVLQYWSRERFK